MVRRSRPQLLPVGAAALAVLAAVCVKVGAFQTGTTTQHPTTARKHETGLQCLNHKDDDGDGLTDCDDPDCQKDPTYGDVCFSFYGPCSLNGIRPKMVSVEDNCANISTGAFQKYCTPICANKFVGFFGSLLRSCKQANSATTPGHAIALNTQFVKLYKSCQLTQSIIHNSNDNNRNNATTCGASDLYPFYVQCSSFLNAKGVAPDGNEFCETTCFELTKKYSRCEGGAKTYFMKSLKTLAPFIRTCAAPALNACTSTVGRISRLCATVDPEKAFATQEDPCFSPCVTSYLSADRSCTKGRPELHNWQGLFDKCTEDNTDHQCTKSESVVLDEISEACCSDFSDQTCTGLSTLHPTMPSFCSPECSSAFLPFYSSCGAIVWHNDSKKLAVMDNFAEVCAAAEGRVISPSHGGTANGTNTKDPCLQIPNCGNCTGVCGWCRDEEGEGYEGTGFCSSACETSTGECEGTLGYGVGGSPITEENTICQPSCEGMVFLDGDHEGMAVCAAEQCDDEQPYVSTYNFGCTDRKRLWGAEHCCDTRSCAAIEQN